MAILRLRERRKSYHFIVMILLFMFAVIVTFIAKYLKLQRAYTELLEEQSVRKIN